MSYRRILCLSSLGIAAAMFAVASEGAAAADTEVKVSKSVVPPKYAGKYKGGGSDPLAEFVKSQTYVDGDVVLASFYALCRANGIPEEQVAKYESQTEVEKPAQGSAGRARMTLGNMLRAKARKDGKLLTLAGVETPLDIAKPAVSGAAAAAQTASTAEPGTAPEPGEEVDDETEVAGEEVDDESGEE